MSPLPDLIPSLVAVTPSYARPYRAEKAR